MKIRRVRTQMFHADGQTDGHDEANAHFSQFCQRALKRIVYSYMRWAPLM
jgi:hypothetical protein